MAKKPPTKDEPAEETTLLMPSTNKVRALAKAKKAAKSQTSTIAGEFGSQMAKAVEENHLDKKAFTISCTLDALDDDRLAITYFHLLRYMDDLKIPERAKAAEGMFEEGETGDGAVKHDEDGKVTPIGRGRRVAEEAGAE